MKRMVLLSIWWAVGTSADHVMQTSIGIVLNNEVDLCVVVLHVVEENSKSSSPRACWFGYLVIKKCVCGAFALHPFH